MKGKKKTKNYFFQFISNNCDFWEKFEIYGKKFQKVF